MYDIKIEAGDALGKLDRIERGTRDMTALARPISVEFMSQTEANFAAEGRPKWMGLKPSTIAARTRAGKWPGMIMQVSGQLAASYSTGYDAGSAWIGSNKVYAAIQNLGGMAGRGRKVKIPARPQLPIDAQGNIQPQAGEAILGIAGDYLANLI